MGKHKYATSPPNLTGMPPGVPYIIGNEAAERFSYYGMKSVLTVFMAHYILNQSGVLAPMNENESYMYTHLFVFGVYFLPVLGAILADGFLGKYWTILSLSVVYCLGNLTLACMATAWGIAIGQRMMLLIGLTLICLGAGGIKPCVSANVGDQFGESNKHLLSKMFGWFYFSINAGSFISSILCPWLLANPKFGPGWAFGIPGITMVIATLFFWGGRNKFVHVPPGGLGYLRETFSKEGLITLARIAMVYVFILVFWGLWGMSNGVEWTLQAEKMNLHWLGMDLIAAQVQTANPILILIFIPLVNYVIYPSIDKVFQLTPLRKIGIGLFLTGLSLSWSPVSTSADLICKCSSSRPTRLPQSQFSTAARQVEIAVHRSGRPSPRLAISHLRCGNFSCSPISGATRNRVPCGDISRRSKRAECTVDHCQ